jgi:hypothetical protein
VIPQEISELPKRVIYLFNFYGFRRLASPRTWREASQQTRAFLAEIHVRLSAIRMPRGGFGSGIGKKILQDFYLHKCSTAKCNRAVRTAAFGRLKGWERVLSGVPGG